MLSLLVPDLLPPNILLLPAPRGWGGVMNKRITSVRGEDRASEGRRLQAFSLSEAGNGL